MIAGIGIDLVRHERIAKAQQRWGRRLEQRLLSSRELDLLPKVPARRLRRIAASFAAKEALAKALGTGFSPSLPASIFNGVSVCRTSAGAPWLLFSGSWKRALKKLGIVGTHLSLADEAGLTIACAVLEKD